MKKLVALAVIFVMMLSLASCGLVGGTGEASITTSGITVTVPEGFEKADLDGTEEYYVNADGSNINWLTTDKDSAFSKITAEIMEKAVVDSYLQQYELEIELVTNSFEKTEVSGCPAYVWDITCTVEGTSIRQCQVGIDADKSYIVTYTDYTADQSWMDDFATCIDGIELIEA